MQFFGHRYVYGKPRGAGTKCSKKFRSGTTSGMPRRQVLGQNRGRYSCIPRYARKSCRGGSCFQNLYARAYSVYMRSFHIRMQPPYTFIVYCPLKSNFLPRPRQSNDDIFQQSGITIAVIFVPIKKGVHSLCLIPLDYVNTQCLVFSQNQAVIFRFYNVGAACITG